MMKTEQIIEITNQCLQNNGLTNYKCHDVYDSIQQWNDKDEIRTIIDCYVYYDNGTMDCIQFTIYKPQAALKPSDIINTFQNMMKMKQH